MENLECDICCYIYDEVKRRPKNLICGHTFCSECMAKEISNGKSTCPTCRKPHNATCVEDLPISVVLERLIRDMPKNMRVGTDLGKSEDVDEDGEEDFSGGPCATHKKCAVYFYCQTHALRVCRECTVIDHQVNKCKIISIKKQVENNKDDNIQHAISSVTAIKDTKSALGEIMKENDCIISNQEIKINQWKKEIEDATKLISTRKTASQKIQNELAQGIVKQKDMETAQHTLQTAKTKKTIALSCKNIEAASVHITKWIQDVTKEFKIVPKPKVTSYDEKSSSPTNILKGLSNKMEIYAETTICGKKAISKLSSRNKNLHVSTFKCENLQKGANIIKYDEILSHLPSQPPTLLYLDLTNNNAYKGRIYMRLEPQIHSFIKHIPALFTGLNGNSVLGNTCANHQGNGLAIWIKGDANGISSCNMIDAPAKTGDIICNHWNEKIWAMVISINSGTTDLFSHAKIGHVESGLDVAIDCKALGNNLQNNITISDCGLVLDI